MTWCPWDDDSRTLATVEKSGHKTFRFAFSQPEEGKKSHESLHGSLVQSGCLLEFSSDGYGAVDLADDAQEAAVLGILGEWFDRGGFSWEWADPSQA